MDSSNGRRIVVTGMGAISPLGVNVASLWDGLVNCRNGIGPITQFDASPYDCQIAGEASDFDPSKHLTPKEARRMARCSQMASACEWPVNLQ